MSGDPEFDDFLQRRRRLFRGDADDGLEPPAELDRLVLRQAREAIEGERPMRLFHMPGWAAPVAVAATLLLGLSLILKTGRGPVERIPEVKVESIAERRAYPPPPAPAAPAATAPAAEVPADGAVVVDLASPAPREPMTARGGAPTSGEGPAWRRDAAAWQAEIERLRANGEQARADAEQAEFERRFRAMATSPDR